MVEQEQSAFNSAFGFLGLIFQSFARINVYRNNFDPEHWYKELRTLDGNTTGWLEVKENYSKKPNQWDTRWLEDYNKIHNEVRLSMNDWEELKGDNIPDEHQQVEFGNAKKKTYEPLAKMTKHLNLLCIKKGWLMPEGENWDDAILG